MCFVCVISEVGFVCDVLRMCAWLLLGIHSVFTSAGCSNIVERFSMCARNVVTLIDKLDFHCNHLPNDA